MERRRADVGCSIPERQNAPAIADAIGAEVAPHSVVLLQEVYEWKPSLWPWEKVENQHALPASVPGEDDLLCGAGGPAAALPNELIVIGADFNSGPDSREVLSVRESGMVRLAASNVQSPTTAPIHHILVSPNVRVLRSFSHHPGGGEKVLSHHPLLGVEVDV